MSNYSAEEQRIEAKSWDASESLSEWYKTSTPTEKSKRKWLAALCDECEIELTSLNNDNRCQAMIDKLNSQMSKENKNFDSRKKTVEAVERFNKSPLNFVNNLPAKETNIDSSKMVSFRCDAALWQSFLEKANSKNLTATALLTQHMKDHLGGGEGQNKIDLQETFDAYIAQRLEPVIQEIVELKEALRHLTQTENEALDDSISS